MPNLSIAFVGDGPERDKLEQVFAGTRSKFFGFLHGEALSAAYASADGFIFPSTTETLGLVLLEAMSSGLPIIAAESLPTKEMLQNGESGIVYRPGDMQSLIHSIETLMAEPSLRQHLGANSRKFAESRNWLAPTEKLLHYYELALRVQRMHASKHQQENPSSKKKLVQI